MKTAIRKVLLVLALIQFITYSPLSAVEFRADNATGATSTQVSIAIRAFDFDSILSCQGSVMFDTTVVTYSGVQDFGLPGMSAANIGVTQVGSGRLSYLWDDQMLMGVSVADSTIIFNIIFNVVGTSGQQSTICFGDMPTQREVVDINFSTVNATYVCGSVQVPGGSNPVATVSVTHVTCFGADNGMASVSVLGGTMPYTYSWSNGATTATISNLAPGPISVTVTDSTGATSTDGDVINQPPSALSITNITSMPETGCGNNDGSASASVTGGTSPYTYSWSNNATTPSINNIPGGIYTLTVTDNNTCTDTASVTVGQSGSTLSATISSSTNVSCFGGSDGSATVTVSGGAGALTYNWSNGDTIQDIDSLVPGVYDVTITDANGCTITDGATITHPAVLTGSTSKVNVSCSGGNNGSINLTVSGGTAPYSYSWAHGPATEDVSTLVAGTYNVTITDA